MDTNFTSIIDTNFTSIKEKLNQPVILKNNISNTHGIQLITLSLLLAFSIVVFISSNFNLIIGISVLVLTVLFYLLFMNYGNNAAIPYALQ